VLKDLTVSIMPSSAITDVHAKQESPGMTTFDDALTSFWKKAVLDEPATAKRHLPGLGCDTDNDRSAKNAAV